MDQFIKNIYFVLDVVKRKPGKKQIIDHNIIEKQYLTYYLYRILCKYEKMMQYVVSKQKIRNIYNILRIPENYQKTCYPLAHKMTYNDQLLELSILGILDIFREVDNTLKESIGNKQYEELIEFLSEKNLEMILLDLKVLQKLFPNLGVTGVKPYLYDFLNSQEIKPDESPNNEAVDKLNNTSANIPENVPANVPANIPANVPENAPANSSNNLLNNLTTNNTTN